jgi:O-acetyl-ADP-ribose deacetylase (regulator of RNase III)
VGPRYGVDEPAVELLASAYLASLRLCDKATATSVAFPSLSTGAFGFPLLHACQISVTRPAQRQNTGQRCVLAAFDDKTQKFWNRTSHRHSSVTTSTPSGI